jgi:hypothetical protein
VVVNVAADGTVVRPLMTVVSKMAVVAMLAEAAWRNGAGDEPERSVIVHLAGFDLRHPRFTGAIGPSLRSALGLAAPDDVTTNGGRLREAGNGG